jgi:hypothetical protein
LLGGNKAPAGHGNEPQPRQSNFLRRRSYLEGRIH